MSWELDMRRFREKTNLSATKIVRRVCLDLFEDVHNDTPVDTGRARFGWGSGINGRTTSGGGMSQILGIIVQAQAGDVIYLTNNVPYIRRLEYGWSKQSPRGMVRHNLQRFPGIVNRAAAQEG